MYTVIGPVKSRALRVLWMLEELGEPYEHRPEAPRSDAVRALNPSGKVPVLLADGAAITDSTAILQFLADRHGRLTHEAGTLERARQDGMTHFVLDEMDAILWTAARHSFILPEERRLPEIKDSLKWEFTRSLERLEERLGDQPFLMGEEMTVPDILCGHCGNWATNARFPVPEEGPVAAYFQRLRDRPAFGRAVAQAA